MSKWLRVVGVVGVVFLTTVILPTTAWADIGTYCTSWQGGGLAGSHQKPCYHRTSTNYINGQGRTYVDNNNGIDQLSIVVQVQRALNDGSPNNWSLYGSNVCGWLDTHISESNTSPNTCDTASKVVVAPGTYLYRARVYVTIFYTGGGDASSNWTYSGLTT
jgi:hypothetical protein